MSKFKKDKCPTCSELKSYNATTCRPCFAKGYGEAQYRGTMMNPHNDEKLKTKIRIAIENVKKEAYAKRKKNLNNYNTP